jgi:hypothetical protein
LDLSIELETGVECAVNFFHELFDAGRGFGRADEGEVKEGKFGCAGAVTSL